jgi:ATP-dependent DNA helicase RecG
MIQNIADLRAAMRRRENEHLEFKAARTRFDFENLCQYCAALANEGGGEIVLGVTDNRPRTIVGTDAFRNLEDTKLRLLNNLRLRIDALELSEKPSPRAVVFRAPSRPIGYPIRYKDVYWMRAGGSLIAMTPEKLQAIFAESGPDYSAEICPGVTLRDLNPEGISTFRSLWQSRSRSAELSKLSDAAVLERAELLVNRKVTYAALILLGFPSAIGRHLAQAEVVFEYRSNEASIPYQQRQEFREGFLLWFDRIWDLINLRNDVQQFRDGLLRMNVPTFTEDVAREAILNAVSHRDYRQGGSVFVRQWPRKLEIMSPGGFPVGVTAENILVRQNPRNRRLADALARCGFVERSGQGADLMFQRSIREGKQRPDFGESDDYTVVLKLHGEIADSRFLQFLEKVGAERLESFSTADFLVLDSVHRELVIPSELRGNAQRLSELGIIEAITRNRFMLSRGLYAFLGQRGVYTRRRGLAYDTNKQLLLQHIQSNNGSPMRELIQVLPNLSREQVKALTYELRDEGQVQLRGSRRSALWFPVEFQRGGLGESAAPPKKSPSVRR